MSEIESKNKALVRRIYEEMWNRADFAAAEEIFASPEGVQRFMHEFLNAFPDLHHTVEELIAEGDRVVARFSAQGTHIGVWKGYLPSGQWKNYASTGNPIHYTGVTIVQVEGDKIIRHQTWWDRLEVVQQISGGPNL